MDILGDKIAVVSDLHIGVSCSSEKWLQQALKFAVWFKNDLLDKGIKHIIIPGDFFHDRTDINVQTIQYASLILDEWKDFKIWMIPGNHDCFYKDNATVSSISILKGYKNVTIFDTTSIETFNNKKFVFVPWGVNVSDIPTGDVIIGHFELNGFKMNSFKVCEGHDESEHILDKASIVLTGHFHLRQELRSKKGLVLYVGTPYEMDYNDMGADKGYHIVTLSDLNIEFIKYANTVKHKRVKVTDLIEHKDTLSGYLSSEIANNVITFIIDKEIEFEKINALVQKIQTFQPFIFRGVEYVKKNETVIDLKDTKANIQTEQLITDFVEQMELENSDEVTTLVLELYNKYKTR